MAGGKGINWNKYLPPGSSQHDQGINESIVMDRLQETPPDLDEFDILIFTMACSKNCPYSADELWNKTFPELSKIRDWVHLQDALNYARHKDVEVKLKK